MTRSAPYHLRRLTRDDADATATLLARACKFQDAPIFAHVLPDPLPRAEFCLDLFAFAVRYACRVGEAWAIGTDAGEMAGAAHWFAMPEPEWTEELQADVGFDTLQMRWKPTLERLRGPLQQANDSLAELAPRWRYLDMIGVDPVYQGQGFGGALLRKVLADAEAAGEPVGLFTDKRENVSFYRHHGFALVWEGTAPGDSLPLWSFCTR
jgi:GNAT superfamily N-acetyltransferase